MHCVKLTHCVTVRGKKTRKKTKSESVQNGDVERASIQGFGERAESRELRNPARGVIIVHITCTAGRAKPCLLWEGLPCNLIKFELSVTARLKK